MSKTGLIGSKVSVFRILVDNTLIIVVQRCTDALLHLHIHTMRYDVQLNG